jgi:pimeloyl-ACP methyl ester carboxylesterase
MINKTFGGVLFISSVIGFAAMAGAQTPGTNLATCPVAAPGNPIAAASAAERAREMKILGIKKLKPSVGAYDIGKPCNANFDEAYANPYPNVPDVLTMKNGTKVKTRAQWNKRRAEIKAIFDEDVYGKYPADIPKVTWKVESVTQQTVKGVPAIVKHVVGHVDNSRDRAITVDIPVDVVTPASMKGKGVPVIIGGGRLHPRVFHRPPLKPGQVRHMLSSPANPPDSAQLLLKRGWGFVSIDYNAVQADNGAGLDQGIIGLTNRGKPRTMDQWGVLRAWAWAAARTVDYLLTDKDVDPHKIGIMGHSRGGKAALVALVDDPRIAIGYISSSGAGGANLYRRNYGETIGNLVAANEFHWFAGNFLRYGAMGFTNDKLPFDSNEFIALAAPRPIFIGGGALITDPKYVPGDAWQDAHGMFMAEVAASPAWTLLGAKGLGTSTFPPIKTLIDSGDMAFRQHPYGHTPAPNWPYFIEFAAKEFAKQR